MQNSILSFLALFLPIVSLSVGVPPPPKSTKILERVPPVLQSTSYSCGAAAILSVLGYYGFDEHNETDAMTEVGTDEAFGTIIQKMAAYAERHGVKARVRANASLQDLKESIHSDQAVLIEAQAWPEKKAIPAHYADVWDQGHYLVVIGIDDKNVYFIDPSLLGGKEAIPVKEFLDRWHDIDEKGQHIQHRGIFFQGTPKPPPLWQAIP
jgi:predicted double-glycine peptidase